MILIVTYNLATTKRDYTAFYESIKASPASSWWHYLDSTWLIDTTETPKHMSERIRSYINEVDDSLLVTKVDIKSRGGWLPQKAWDWIKARTV